LAIEYVECGIPAKSYYFKVGKYAYSSISGIGYIDPLPGMGKLSYDEIKAIIAQ
jgi:hypothetical protein